MNKICSVDGCHNTVWSSGLCNKHRQRKARGRLHIKSWSDPNDYETHGDVTHIILRNINGDVVAKAIIDAEDKEKCSSRKWYFRNNDGYACSSGNSIVNTVFLHHFIYGVKTITDHINRDRLDNRRCNLRAATMQQNILNSTVRKDNSLGIKGVHMRKGSRRVKKFYATLRINGQDYRSNYFASLEEAIKARKDLEAKHHLPIWRE